MDGVGGGRTCQQAAVVARGQVGQGGYRDLLGLHEEEQ